MAVILGAGLISGYLILKDSLNLPAGSNSTSQQADNTLQTEQNPVAWAGDSQSNSKNITQDIFGTNLGNAINQQIANASSTSNWMPNVDSASQDVIDKSYQEAQKEFNQTVSDSDLKISSDNSMAAKINYFNEIGNISQKDFNGFTESYTDVMNDAQNGNLSSASQLSNIYHNVANDYLNLTVPSDLVGLDKQLVMHFKNAEMIFGSIANYSNDPVKAYFAVQTMNDLIAQGETDQNLLNSEIKKVGL